MEFLNSLLESISSWVWGPPMLLLLMGTHIFLTVRLKGIQRELPTAIRLSLKRNAEGKGDISHFAALTTALAATIGTGNIIGVATAITAGGPGAVFWMWITGVLGIPTKYAEALLAVKYRVTTHSGEQAGGPMYVIERGLGWKWLGIAFAVFTAFAAFGIGNTVQANAIADMARISFGIPPITTGVVLSFLTGLVILGGIRSIARVCQLLVPVMALVYIAGCFLLLIRNFFSLPDSILLIGKGAFSGQAAVGGFLGAGVREAVRYGVARGLFSNESGLGSAPIVAAAAQTNDPVRQALVSSTGTFWDTVVICFITGLVLVNSGHWQDGLSATELSKAAFGELKALGPFILNFGLLTFVFSTLLGWCYYGEKATEYLFGPPSVPFYRIIWVAAPLVGATAASHLTLIWNLADIANALMAIPNLVSLILLNTIIVQETNRYHRNGFLE
ncbi:MAG TPA: sodium:alanine symporter family protein [Candidatus Hydrogenedentes bacterium]|nr:sodium:alanine symporter family protein [Candidatus Hydrogenedentota bacterium]HOL77371.1 sodium:alanine symporter family protein [Candidatus Hydrogenedentota bacterium]HPO84811.1 sodium:alanine symporter family protein [Candidatus Hydrogenedentota bacterium]